MVRSELHNRTRVYGTRPPPVRGESQAMNFASVKSTKPIRRILAPLDGTAFGEYSLPIAINIARRSGAELQLVHVLPVPGTDAPPIRHYFPDLYGPSRNDRRAYLDGLADQVACDTAVARPILIEHQSPLTALSQLAGEVDLVVMATHARGPLGRLIHGGITHRLMRDVSTPVIVVPVRGQPSPLSLGKDIGRVVIALDGTTEVERVVDQAIAVGSAFQASYTLVRVIAPRPRYADMYGGASYAHSYSFDQESQVAFDFMQMCAEQMRVRGLTVNSRIIYDGRPPAQAIVEVAERIGAGLIVLSTQRRGVLRRFLSGSTTTSVIRRTSVPVLVACPDGPQVITTAESYWNRFLKLIGRERSRRECHASANSESSNGDRRTAAHPHRTTGTTCIGAV